MRLRPAALGAAALLLALPAGAGAAAQAPFGPGLLEVFIPDAPALERRLRAAGLGSALEAPGSGAAPAAIDLALPGSWSAAELMALGGGALRLRWDRPGEGTAVARLPADPQRAAARARAHREASFVQDATRIAVAQSGGAALAALEDAAAARARRARVQRACGLAEDAPAPDVLWWAAPPSSTLEDGPGRERALRALGLPGEPLLAGCLELLPRARAVRYRLALLPPGGGEADPPVPLRAADAEPPPAWVPADVETYLRLGVDLRRAARAFGATLDALAGEAGLADELLDALADDPAGPRIDLRRELGPHLAGPIEVVADRAADGSVRSALAVPVDDAEPVAALLASWAARDPRLAEAGPGVLRFRREAPADPDDPLAAAFPDGLGLGHGRLWLGWGDGLLARLLSGPSAATPLAGDGELGGLLALARERAAGAPVGWGWFRRGDPAAAAAPGGTAGGALAAWLLRGASVADLAALRGPAELERLRGHVGAAVFVAGSRDGALWRETGAARLR